MRFNSAQIPPLNLHDLVLREDGVSRWDAPTHFIHKSETTRVVQQPFFVKAKCNQCCVFTKADARQIQSGLEVVRDELRPECGTVSSECLEPIKWTENLLRFHDGIVYADLNLDNKCSMQSSGPLTRAVSIPSYDNR